MDSHASTSTRPYLIRAMYEWCTDNGYTPYVAVQVDDSVQVPVEYVKDGEIVLNVSMDATSSLKLGNEFVEFRARFAGVARDIVVPVNRVMAIYARENGQGMAFPPEDQPQVDVSAEMSVVPEVVDLPEVESQERPVHLTMVERNDDGSVPPESPRPSGGARPSLKRVK
ncbi:MAG: ClpXP protease specificity-enhancing factor [Hylemonella sp.]|nr:ClpXP protease specificity-enhancing factor [Hylemonella sp.]MDH5707737.1 ClpXP protease specificity-enhancing factor [Hylemonella sp.]